MRCLLLFVLLFWVGCLFKKEEDLFKPKPDKPPITDAHIYDQTSPPAKDLAARIEVAFRQEIKKHKQLHFSDSTSAARETDKQEVMDITRKNSVKELEGNTFEDLSLWRDLFAVDLLIFGVLKGSDYSQILELYAVDLKNEKVSSRVQIFFLLDAQNTEQDLAALAAKEVQRIVSAK